MKEDKTVGVVIPIYNVQDYLRECLDSVINQTYKNLQVVLVNDGSTDENSLNIAKEYTLKDERFILFDKKNAGLSSSRNVGIEYFSKEYKLKNITNDIKENSLVEFSIEGNNPYEIYKVYKSSKFFKNKDELLNFQTPNIDYIIFLDSDDYWELNCIEECVPRMDGVEVVWFDHYFFYDNIEKPEIIPQTIIQMHQYQQGKIDVKTFFKNMMNLKLDSFWFGWHGMINFKYLKKINLKFLNQVLHEDHYFGKLLFFQLNNIYIFPKKLLYYRIRKGSIMNYSNEKSYIPEYALDDYKILEENYFTYKQYHRNSSLFLTALMVFNFIDKYNNHDDLFNQIFLNKLKTWRDELLNFNPKYLNIVLYLSFSKLFKLSNNVDKNLKLISNFIKDNIIIKNTQINNLESNINNLESNINNLESNINNLESNINNLESNINNLESELKICKHISNFHSLYGTAKQRIQNQLSYKLGQSMIINSKSIFGIIFMPIYLLSIFLTYKQEQKIYKQKIKKDPSLKLPPLESYPDYNEALKFKEHLSYKSGKALLKAFKTWYKGGLFRFWFKIKKLKKRNSRKIIPSNFDDGYN